MSKYETYSLILTATYDILTFLLLAFVVYEGIIKPKLPDIAFYLQKVPIDTMRRYSIEPLMDFVLENRGIELKNLRIISDPDNLGWGKLGPDSEYDIQPKSTSEYFKKIIPFLAKNEKHQFFWCDIDANSEFTKQPFKIIIEFDNPVFPWPKRIKRFFYFNLSVFEGVLFNANVRYDTHNIAQENCRIREELEKIGLSISEISGTIKKLR